MLTRAYWQRHKLKALAVINSNPIKYSLGCGHNGYQNATFPKILYQTAFRTQTDIWHVGRMKIWNSHFYVIPDECKLTQPLNKESYCLMVCWTKPQSLRQLNQSLRRLLQSLRHLHVPHIWFLRPTPDSRPLGRYITTPYCIHDRQI